MVSLFVDDTVFSLFVGGTVFSLFLDGTVFFTAFRWYLFDKYLVHIESRMDKYDNVYHGIIDGACCFLN